MAFKCRDAPARGLRSRRRGMTNAGRSHANTLCSPTHPGHATCVKLHTGRGPRQASPLCPHSSRTARCGKQLWRRPGVHACMYDGRRRATASCLAAALTRSCAQPRLSPDGSTKIQGAVTARRPHDDCTAAALATVVEAERLAALGGAARRDGERREVLATAGGAQLMMVAWASRTTKYLQITSSDQHLGVATNTCMQGGCSPLGRAPHAQYGCKQQNGATAAASASLQLSRCPPLRGCVCKHAGQGCASSLQSAQMPGCRHIVVTASCPPASHAYLPPSDSAERRTHRPASCRRCPSRRPGPPRSRQTPPAPSRRCRTTRWKAAHGRATTRPAGGAKAGDVVGLGEGCGGIALGAKHAFAQVGLQVPTRLAELPARLFCRAILP